MCLRENINTGEPLGKLLYYISGIFAEIEHDTIKERTLAGLHAARARGRVGGRREVISDEKLEFAKKLLRNPDLLLDR